MSARNFASEKEIKHLEEVREHLDEIGKHLEAELGVLLESNKVNENTILKHKNEIEQLKYNIEEKKDEINHIENSLLQKEDEIFQLKEEYDKEIARCVEGLEFNEKEARRFLDQIQKTKNLFVPQILNEIVKIQEIVNAKSLKKMIAIHAVLGRIKHSNLKHKIKLIVKLMLRFFGIKKNLYLNDIRVDLRIENSIANIIEIASMMNEECPSGESYNIDKKPTKSNDQIVKKYQEEVIISLEPKISVLLPVYNHAKFIKSAIESVQLQSYRNWELIILNDGSTDNLLEILQDYSGDPRIKMYTQENQRLPNALTNLHKLANGQFVTWTSADNIMEREMLETLAHNLTIRPEAVMVFGDVSIIDDKGEFVTHGYREMNRDKKLAHILRLPHSEDALDAECDNYINACFMYRMEAAIALNGEYGADLEGLEDYDFWLRLRAFGKIVHIKNEKPMYRYRVHNNTMSETIMKDELEEHLKRGENLIKYSHLRSRFIHSNCKLLINNDAKGAGELKSILAELNYNYVLDSHNKVSFIKEEEILNAPIGTMNLTLIDDKYNLIYINENKEAERRIQIYSGTDIPPIAKKVRQILMRDLFWEYPIKFVNMQVIGCHCDLKNIDIEKTVIFLNHNQDKLFSFCCVNGGRNLETEKEILAKCRNAIFMGEKEIGTPFYLYASWDNAFVPPMKYTNDNAVMQSIILSWNIGKWIMVEQNDMLDHIYPLVCQYNIDEKLIGIKTVEDIDSIEEILDKYIYIYSKKGAVEKVLRYLGGIGQDIFVERPDFKLEYKVRKFPPMQLYKNRNVSRRLQKGYIAFMVDTLDKGGLEQIVALLSKGIRSYGIEIKVFCTKRGGSVAEQLKSEKIEVLEFGGNENKFNNYLIEKRPLLINTHYAKEMLDVVYKNGIPMIEVIHNMYVFQDNNMWENERKIEPYFNKIIAVSKLVKEIYVKKHGNIEECKIEVIGNAACTDKIYGENRKFVRGKLNIPNDSVLFINVSSIDGRKNQLGLIAAFEIYNRTINPNSYLIIVGNILSEFYDNAVMQFINEQECKNNILKLGYYHDIASLYNAADVFVMPSYFEGWSVAATEALYCGLPIIHSRCGSALELYKDGKNGILISNPAGDITNVDSMSLSSMMGNRLPENTEELVEAMCQITTNLEEWDKNRQLITCNALLEFSKEKMIKKYIECFEKVIS